MIQGFTWSFNKHSSCSIMVIERANDHFAFFDGTSHKIMDHYVINERFVARLNALKLPARCQATTRNTGSSILYASYTCTYSRQIIENYFRPSRQSVKKKALETEIWQLIKFRERKYIMGVSYIKCVLTYAFEYLVWKFLFYFLYIYIGN